VVVIAVAVVVVVVVVVVIVVVVVVGIIPIQGIYSSLPDALNIPMVHNFAATPQLLFTVHVILFLMLTVLYSYLLVCTH
jgi:hypothetical protein